MLQSGGVGMEVQRGGAGGMRWLWCGRGRLLSLAAVVVVTVVVKVMLSVKRSKRRARWAGVGRDVVVLHIFPRGTTCPSLSPFVMKLETYLRLASIPYLVDYEEPLGPKGKCPWITLNGEEIGDSHLIINHLRTRYKKDFSSHLSGKERGEAHCIRVMMDEHFFWVNVLWRWVYDRQRAVCSLTHWGTWLPFPWVYRPLVALLLHHQAKMQGVGRHTWAQVFQLGWEDLHALSVYLGDKRFLTGDKPTEADCSVFGMLSQVIWNSPGSPFLAAVKDDFPNLLAYCQRVRDMFWPDWNRCLNPPGPAPALLA